MKVAYDAVLLLAFGGPQDMTEVRPFLRSVLEGRPVPTQRFEEVVSHYAHFDGRSPLKQLTLAQAEALQDELRKRGLPLRVHVGMRHSSPTIAEALSGLRRTGARNVLALILSALQTEASEQRYQTAVQAALQHSQSEGAPALQIEYAPCFVHEPGFVQANAEQLKHTLERVPERTRARALVLFSAHSIPLAMAEGSPYVRQFERCAREVAQAAGHDRYSTCYQSRSGRLDEPWLEPDINDALREEQERGRDTVVVQPLGFVCDHVEVLYDLDVEAAETARTLGLTMLRAPSANAHPAFVRALANTVQSACLGSSV